LIAVLLGLALVVDGVPVLDLGKLILISSWRVNCKAAKRKNVSIQKTTSINGMI
jgi:hypothetical protein